MVYRSQLLTCALSFLFLLLGLSCSAPTTSSDDAPGWPEITNQTKPWTRWWWHGSQVTKEGITAEMEAYQRAGIGGLEITPIYGVYREEDQFIDFLSPQWMEMLVHVLDEAKRLDMGIDMATGTGWPFGGPWVTSEDACKNIQYKVYELAGGEQLSEKIEFVQEPYLRLVGNQIYEVNENAEAEGRALLGSRKEPALVEKNEIKITDLVEPVERNKNLQALAIDQIQFEKTLRLVTLMAYNETGQSVKLTDKVDSTGKLSWVAPQGTWKIYAIFEGYHGKMVERAGPGGEGNVIDHFSEVALSNYLSRFDSAFQNYDLSSLRAFFNDSYEVDDARGSSDFTPSLFDEFAKRQGYDLRDELPALFGNDDSLKSARVLCDYRETLSELLLENFTIKWKKWAHQKDKIVRNQAHGSPANILDLYATIDIPEIEGTEPLRFKMATSSGNVTGKKLVSAEAATWLNEHFVSGLSDIKAALDNFMLHGVNHLVYHGTCYSPAEEPWPGRLFYAAIHMNPRNPMWKDADALNAYVARCQSFLQRSLPDNDVLLYYPVHDPMSTRGPEMVEHFDGIGRAFDGTSFENCAEIMLENGYAFDYISDNQLKELSVDGGAIRTNANGLYKTIVVPATRFMPLETLSKIVSLAESGASVVFIELPEYVSGYSNLEANEKAFKTLIEKINTYVQSSDKSVHLGNSLAQQLTTIGVERETMFDRGVYGLRKKEIDGTRTYFVVNKNSELFEGWLPLRENAERFVIYDPMNSVYGMARQRESGSGTEVFVQLQPSQSLIIEGQNRTPSVDEFPYIEAMGEAISLDGRWNLRFVSGGPELPPSLDLDSLTYWTEIEGESYGNFSGTAAYTITFDRPQEKSAQWLLQLTDVKNTAEIFLNEKPLGTMIGPTYQLVFDNAALKDKNVLEIHVSNLMANRIADLDKKGIFWKKFYNVNFPARLRENVKNNIFDASHWQPFSSGVSGPALLYRLQ